MIYLCTACYDSGIRCTEKDDNRRRSTISVVDVSGCYVRGWKGHVVVENKGTCIEMRTSGFSTGMWYVNTRDNPNNNPVLIFELRNSELRASFTVLHYPQLLSGWYPELNPVIRKFLGACCQVEFICIPLSLIVDSERRVLLSDFELFGLSKQQAF